MPSPPLRRGVGHETRARELSERGGQLSRGFQPRGVYPPLYDAGQRASHALQPSYDVPQPFWTCLIPPNRRFVGQLPCTLAEHLASSGSTCYSMSLHPLPVLRQRCSRLRYPLAKHLNLSNRHGYPCYGLQGATLRESRAVPRYDAIRAAIRSKYNWKLRTSSIQLHITSVAFCRIKHQLLQLYFVSHATLITTTTPATIHPRIPIPADALLRADPQSC